MVAFTKIQSIERASIWFPQLLASVLTNSKKTSRDTILKFRTWISPNNNIEKIIACWNLSLHLFPLPLRAEKKEEKKKRGKTKQSQEKVKRSASFRFVFQARLDTRDMITRLETRKWAIFRPQRDSQAVDSLAVDRIVPYRVASHSIVSQLASHDVTTLVTEG